MQVEKARREIDSSASISGGDHWSHREYQLLADSEYRLQEIGTVRARKLLRDAWQQKKHAPPVSENNHKARSPTAGEDARSKSSIDTWRKSFADEIHARQPSNEKATAANTDDTVLGTDASMHKKPMSPCTLIATDRKRKRQTPPTCNCMDGNCKRRRLNPISVDETLSNTIDRRHFAGTYEREII